MLQTNLEFSETMLSLLHHRLLRLTIHPQTHFLSQCFKRRLLLLCCVSVLGTSRVTALLCTSFLHVTCYCCALYEFWTRHLLLPFCLAFYGFWAQLITNLIARILPHQQTSFDIPKKCFEIGNRWSKTH